MKYYQCECGSDEFNRIYNVWIERIKVKVSDDDLWDVEEHGKVKDHPYGYVCAKCGKDAQELNDGI